MTHSSLPPRVCTGEGPQTSECTSAPKASACGALRSLRMGLRVALAYSHESQTKVGMSSVQVRPVTAPCFINVRMAVREMWPRRLCRVSSETVSIAAPATTEWSTLYRPFALAGTTPMTLPALFLILQASPSKDTAHPALVMRLMETMVSAISGACSTSLKTTDEDDSPLGTSTCRSPVPTA